MAIRLTRPRYINLYPKSVQAALGQTAILYEEVPGLTLFAYIPVGEVRGYFTTTDGACYVVVGSGMYRLHADSSFTLLGSLLTTAGPVEMDANKTQLCAVDGDNGYVVTLLSDAFQRITDGAFYGAKRFCVIDGYGIFVRPDTEQFYISDYEDFTTFDALDFAAAEGSPDKAVAIVADHRQARVFGTHTTEGWFDSGDPDFPFSRDPSSYSEIGTNAPYTPRSVLNSVCFLGQNQDGNGVVYMATGNTVERISTPEIEALLAESTDLTQARAFSYQADGCLHYVLNAPGMATTLVYEVSSREWHERAEIIGGDYSPWRPVCHTFAFGFHLVGDVNGKIYKLDRSVHTNSTDPISRERIIPHSAIPSLERIFFGVYELDATAGDAASGIVPKVLLRYSNDGGRTWATPWMERELGRTGEYSRRARWLSNGSGYDRVWHERCTDDAPFSIIRSKVQASG
jgi:hypothetical protein